MFTSLRLGPVALALCVLASCGHKDKGGSGTTTSPVANTNNTVGTPIDGGRGSMDPHPAACTTCQVNTLTQVQGCDPATTAGMVQPCEGFCFVDPSVEPEWANEPPSSGPAYPDEQHFAFGDQNTTVARGYWVHNLAHGFVVILHNCPQGCDSELDSLRKFYNTASYTSVDNGVKTVRTVAGSTVFITADPSLQGKRFAVVAWNYLQTFDRIDDAALAQLTCFVGQHVRHGYPHGNYTPPLQ